MTDQPTRAAGTPDPYGTDLGTRESIENHKTVNTIEFDNFGKVNAPRTRIPDWELVALMATSNSEGDPTSLQQALSVRMRKNGRLLLIQSITHL